MSQFSPHANHTFFSYSLGLGTAEQPISGSNCFHLVLKRALHLCSTWMLVWCLPLFHTHHQMHFCAQISLQLNLKVHQLLPNTISAENYTFTLFDFQWILCLKLEVVSGQLVTPWPCRTWCISYTTFKCTKFLYRYGCFEGSSVKLVQRTCSETEKRQNAYRKCVTNHSAQMTHNY